tara:strand:+ start:2294 stop:2530 length:237 start_codon:yes stop_codon:yes gene_type:complete
MLTDLSKFIGGTNSRDLDISGAQPARNTADIKTLNKDAVACLFTIMNLALAAWTQKLSASSITNFVVDTPAFSLEISF